MLCELAGEEAALREWVYYSEVKFIPAKDLQTMDKLWRAYSRDRYGFSIQRQLWIAGKQKWGALFKRIAWVAGENNAYKKWPGEFTWEADAPKGHLPLTNCLRGTQLFQAVLEHPAFGGPVIKPEVVEWLPYDGGYSKPPPERAAALAALGLFAAYIASFFFH